MIAEAKRTMADDIAAEERREAKLRARPREARHAEGATWSTPQFVTQAKCAAHKAGCTGTANITAEGLAALETSSKQLIARGEAPLDLNGCFLCDACVVRRNEVQARKADDRRAKATEAIRFCKNTAGADLDHAWTCVQKGLSGRMPSDASHVVVAAMERLEFLRKVEGSGYVNDLLVTIREKNSGTKAKPRRGEM